MFASILKKFFGSANDRVVKKYDKLAKQIGLLESDFVKLTDEELRNYSQVLKGRLEKGETLDDILPEAFSAVREASKRVLGMRPFDVQLIGGLVLHNGMIAEMKTGEGKTLMATLPVYLNALSDKGVHVVTVNDYLAKRDAAWMGEIYGFLGLKVGCIVHGLNDDERRQAYAADVTYGTNHEFGFDYLRDNMKFRLEEMVMRPFNYAIVDEVDSILIDEARTPLIISGAAEDSSELYQKIDALIPSLNATDYEKDEKQRSVTLTESGVEKIEKLLFEKGLIKGNGLYDVQNFNVVPHVNSALRAHKIYVRDVDYIVKNNQVILIDEFTGRMMEGRRLSEGLHQAIEAKEKVPIEMENQTLASITYQNFFRLYPKLSGMAGTAVTEADEFEEIYNLQAIEIPPNVPVARIDHDDEVYLTMREKYTAVINQIKDCHSRKQPLLVGTTSIEKSEFLSNLLKEQKIPHQVLNARYHEQEAFIIADAGCSGAITIATNMAGRGTDIKLGGNLEMRLEKELGNMASGSEKDKKIAAIKQEIEKDQERVKKAGGLYVIGTERHESRRIDNQLRGRSGRQGDPGASKFFISLEDDLMRIFGSERLDPMLRKLGVQENETISHSWITKALERAQRKVEARNFDIRKHLLRYDDVNNAQRKIVYEQRLDLMRQHDISEMVEEIMEEIVTQTVLFHAPTEILPDQWDIKGFHAEASRLFNLNLPLEQWIHEETINTHEIEHRIYSQLKEKMTAKNESYGALTMRAAEKNLLLRILDQAWKDHLLSLDHLRQGINLRAYAQSNPLNEYKREAFNLFQYMMQKLKGDFISVLSHFDIKLPENMSVENVLNPHINFDDLHEMTPENWAEEQNELTEVSAQPVRKRKSHEQIDPQNPETWGRVQRNALCPCGSDKKYKHCHGAIPD